MATVLKVEKREGKGKYVAFNLRKEGRIPGVVYGKTLKENVNISLSLKDFQGFLKTGERLVDLDMNGTGMHVLLKVVQHGTYDHEILHVDFRAVSDDEVVEVVLEIELKGDAVGVGKGGMMEHNLHQIHVRSKPRDIPEKVVVDISKMDIGDIFYARDLPAIKGVEYVFHGNPAVVSCHEPRSAEEPAAAEGEAPATPEVIGEKEREAKEKDGK